MGLLRGKHLAEQILPDRFGQELPAAASGYGEKPGQDRIANQSAPAMGLSSSNQRAERSTITSAKGRESRDHEDQRAFKQDAGGNRRPEYGRDQPCADSIDASARCHNLAR